MKATIEVHQQMRESVERYTAAKRAWLLADESTPELDNTLHSAAEDLASWVGVAVYGAEWTRLNGVEEFWAKGRQA